GHGVPRPPDAGPHRVVEGELAVLQLFVAERAGMAIRQAGRSWRLRHDWHGCRTESFGGRSRFSRGATKEVRGHSGRGPVQHPVTLRTGSDRLGLLRGREGQFAVVAVVIDDHRLTVADLTREQALGQLRLDLPLNDAPERPS